MNKYVLMLAAAGLIAAAPAYYAFQAHADESAPLADATTSTGSEETPAAAPVEGEAPAADAAPVEGEAAPAGDEHPAEDGHAH